MYTVKSVMTQLTDPEVVLQRVSDTLRRIDPSFPEEERQYYQAVDSLKKNEVVEILETTTVDGEKWGKISNGWISMAYVDLD